MSVTSTFSLCPHPAPTEAHGRSSAGPAISGFVSLVNCYTGIGASQGEGGVEKDKETLLKCRICFRALCSCKGVNCTMVFSRHNRMS